MKISKYAYDPLILRQAVADATLEDGRIVEVAFSLSGEGYIGMITGKDGKHIATYCLHARDFVDEMLACEKGEAEFNVIEKEKGNKR
jgi:hypothetical protein